MMIHDITTQYIEHWRDRQNTNSRQQYMEQPLVQSKNITGQVSEYMREGTMPTRKIISHYKLYFEITSILTSAKLDHKSKIQ